MNKNTIISNVDTYLKNLQDEIKLNNEEIQRIREKNKIYSDAIKELMTKSEEGK